MARLNPYQMEVKTKSGAKEIVDVHTAPGKDDQNWKIAHRGGWCYFDKKESVKTYLERKYPKGVKEL